MIVESGRLVQFEDEHTSESPPDVSRSNESDPPIVQEPTEGVLNPYFFSGIIMKRCLK